MKLKIALAGATGWVGRSLSAAIHKSPNMELVTAISPEYSKQNLGKILNIPDLDLIIAKNTQEALTNTTAQVFIDFTTPTAVKNNVLTAISYGLHVIIGTSGLTQDDYDEIAIKANAKKVGVIAAGNFSLTATLMKYFSKIAARYISEWEIIDYASSTKPDAPSGTARELAEALSLIRKPYIQIPVDETHGSKEIRGANINGTQVHSIRLPGYTLAIESIFGMPDEKLIIYHEAGQSPLPYIAGVLLAAEKVSSITGLIRGLDHLLGLN